MLFTHFSLTHSLTRKYTHVIIWRWVEPRWGLGFLQRVAVRFTIFRWIWRSPATHGYRRLLTQSLTRPLTDSRTGYAIDPERTIPKSILLCFSTVTVLAFLVLVSGSGVSPSETLLNSEAPLMDGLDVVYGILLNHSFTHSFHLLTIFQARITHSRIFWRTLLLLGWWSTFLRSLYLLRNKFVRLLKQANYRSH